jgi:putative ABC transport system permease protein
VLLETLQAMPGVLSAGSGEAPLSYSYADWIQFREYDDGAQPTEPAEEMVMSYISFISPGYFETLGIPIIRGEGLPEWDGANDWRRHYWTTQCQPDRAPFCSERAEFGKVVVSESFADAACPGQDPIGKDLGLYDCCWTVAGVVPDVARVSVLSPAHAYNADLPNNHSIYYSLERSGGGGKGRGNTILVRTAGDPLLMVPAVREAILSIDDLLSIKVSTMEARVDDALATPRFHMLIGGIFAAVALLLALTGLYGIVSYTVAQRTHEIGVRIALGARREDIRVMVVRGGLSPVLLGVGLGILASLASIRVLEALLYGMSALDPGLIAGLAVALVLVTAAACYVPARRASAVDPVVALASE